jgi:hypothetical protein
MQVSFNSSAVSSLFALDKTQATQQVGSNGVSTDDMPPLPPAGGGGSQMMQAVMQALQSLGLSPSSLDTSASTTNDVSTTTASGGSAATSSSSSSDAIREDMHQFMHALFEAMKSEGSSGSSDSTSTTATGSGDPQNQMASDLSSLISDVSNGNAPSGLQAAFSKLASDLESSGASASSSTSTDSTSSSASLQAFLTALQQDLGYGATSSTSSVGSVVSTQV